MITKPVCEKFVRLISLTLCLSKLVPAVSAATKTWDGGGADANWSTAANWVNNIAPVSGDVLFFPGGVSKTTATNNFAANTDFGGILFGGSYVLRGNAVDLTNAIAATANLKGIVELDVRLVRPCVLSADAGADLALRGNLNLNGFAGTLGSNGTVTITGVVSGSGAGSQLIKNGLGAQNSLQIIWMREASTIDDLQSLTA